MFLLLRPLTPELPDGEPVQCLSQLATTASTSSTAAATAGVAAAATTDSHWFQRLLNMGPPSAASVTPSMDVTGINPLLFRKITTS